MSAGQLPPQHRVALEFMAFKGYTDARIDEWKKETRFSWIYYFLLPEGQLELLVTWDPEQRRWDAKVTDFFLDGGA